MRFLFRLITKPIGCLFSLLFSLVILVVLVAVGCVLVVDHYAADIAGTFLKEKTGFELSYAKQEVTLFGGLVDFQGLRLTNSSEFPVPDFVEFNEFKAAVEPRSLLADRIVVDEVVVDLKNVTIVKKADGTYNAKAFADALKAAIPANQSAAAQQKPGASGSSKVPPFIIKTLTVKIGTVDYCDYSSGSGSPKVYNINYSRTFTDVTDVKTVATAMAKDFAGFGMTFMADMIVSTLTNFNTYLDLANGVLNGAGQVGGKVLDVGQGVVNGAAKGAGGLLKSINPF